MNTPSCEAKVFFPASRFFFPWTCLLSLIVQLSQWGGWTANNVCLSSPSLTSLQAYVTSAGLLFMPPRGSRPWSLELGAQAERVLQI